jgi:hypothetical protein
MIDFISIFADPIDRMPIDYVIEMVKRKNSDAELHHHVGVGDNVYAVIKNSYAAVGVASRLGDYSGNANDAWRNALRSN